MRSFVGFCLLLLACDVTASRRQDAEVRELRAKGRELFFGRAGCATCHKIGEEGKFIIGPNLGTRLAIEYVVESIVTPDAITVSGYAPGVMKDYTQPPISLTDDEIIALAAFVAGEGDGAKVKYAEVAGARERLKALRPEP
jgi:mono/diheme cytochrome c family protein